MDENLLPVGSCKQGLAVGGGRALLRIQQKSLLPCEAESQKLNFVHRANLPPLCTLRLR
ncbi:hypothetical protein T03_8157 [Trichinella britovi]|uniref:Uncharacterized protein n=1 Tax=Trichinella britovi TaxID=45882 RepID=A0A0V1BCD8_TRIBR|nr:hypothetical protein T03_15939 [Trichinella britovi]KRY34708.1 hypothetical protein T03_8157 [Trichinella britovi]